MYGVARIPMASLMPILATNSYLSQQPQLLRSSYGGNGYGGIGSMGNYYYQQAAYPSSSGINRQSTLRGNFFPWFFGMRRFIPIYYPNYGYGYGYNNFNNNNNGYGGNDYGSNGIYPPINYPFDRRNGNGYGGNGGGGGRGNSGGDDYGGGNSYDGSDTGYLPPSSSSSSAPVISKNYNEFKG